MGAQTLDFQFLEEGEGWDLGFPCCFLREEEAAGSQGNKLNSEEERSNEGPEFWPPKEQGQARQDPAHVLLQKLNHQSLRI